MPQGKRRMIPFYELFKFVLLMAFGYAASQYVYQMQRKLSDRDRQVRTLRNERMDLHQATAAAEAKAEEYAKEAYRLRRRWHEADVERQHAAQALARAQAAEPLTDAEAAAQIAHYRRANETLVKAMRAQYAATHMPDLPAFVVMNDPLRAPSDRIILLN